MHERKAHSSRNTFLPSIWEPQASPANASIYADKEHGNQKGLDHDRIDKVRLSTSGNSEET